MLTEEQIERLVAVVETTLRAEEIAALLAALKDLNSMPVGQDSKVRHMLTGRIATLSKEMGT